MEEENKGYADSVLAEIEANKESRAVAEEVEAVESSPATDKTRKKAIRKLVATLFLIVTVLAVFIFAIYSRYMTSKLQEVRNSFDNPMMAYEADIDIVQDVITLFEVHNNETYSQAKTAVRLSPELMKRYFPTDEYTGAMRSSEKPEVTVTDVRFSMDVSKGYNRYMMRLVRGNPVTYEISDAYVLIDVKGGVITNLYSY